jgi:hypothetical protein
MPGLLKIKTTRKMIDLMNNELIRAAMLGISITISVQSIRDYRETGRYGYILLGAFWVAVFIFTVYRIQTA